MTIRTLFVVSISLLILDIVLTLRIITKGGQIIEDLILKEKFCIPYNLYEDEINVINDQTVFWKSLNQSFTVEMFNEEHGERTICAPMKFIRDASRPNCWTLNVNDWAFSIDPINKSLEINLMGYKKLYDKSEYLFDSITKQATIFCFEGSFEPCAGLEKNFIKLGLDGDTLLKYQKDNTTLKLFEGEYGKEYLTYKPDYQRNPWVCFSTVNMSTHPCHLWIVYNKTEFEILSDNSVRLKVTHFIYAKNEYKLLSDGTISVCKEKADSKLSYSIAEGVTTFVAFSISLIGLTLFMLAFAMFQELRTFSRKVLFCFSITLFFAQLFFIFRLIVDQYTAACHLIGILNHFFFLSTFFWMGIISYDVSITILKTHVNDLNREEQFQRLLRYSIVAWGGSLFVVFIAIMVDQLSKPNDFQPKYEELCWLSNKKSLLLFFNSFIALIILMNICLFSATAAYIIKTTRQTQGFRTKDNKRNTFIIFLRLAILMGFCWIFGFLYLLVKSDIIVYIFICLNAPQGLYIFLGFTFVNGVKNRLRNRFCTKSQNKQDWPTSVSVSTPGHNNRKASTTSKELTFITNKCPQKSQLEPKLSTASNLKLVK